jgi:tRNA (guanine37-N1)-methyltransferase
VAERFPQGGPRTRARHCQPPMPPLSLAPCPIPTTPQKGRSHARLSISPSLKPRSLMDETPRLKGAWCAKVLTLFPETFPGVLGASLTGKALQQGLWALETIDLRTFGKGKHRQVDDTPAGGGAGS